MYTKDGLLNNLFGGSVLTAAAVFWFIGLSLMPDYGVDYTNGKYVWIRTYDTVINIDRILGNGYLAPLLFGILFLPVMYGFCKWSLTIKKAMPAAGSIMSLFFIGYSVIYFLLSTFHSRDYIASSIMLVLATVSILIGSVMYVRLYERKDQQSLYGDSGFQNFVRVGCDNRTLKLTGQSMRVYSFELYNLNTKFNDVGCYVIYIISKCLITEGGKIKHDLIYCGKTNRLHRCLACHPQAEDIKKCHPTHVGVMEFETERELIEVEMDLIQENRFLCNGEKIN